MRQRLGEQKEETAGLFAGSPKCWTAQSMAERFLKTFCEVTLAVIFALGFAQQHVTPLSLLQQQILALFGFSSAVYHRLADDT